MRYWIVIFLLVGQTAYGQSDTLKKWRPYGVGIGYMDGLSQYFEGYDHHVLLANSSTGLPLYSDWDSYSRLSFNPGFWQTGAWMQFANRKNTSRFRLNLTYTFRSDTLAYTSIFELRDTIFGRSAIENNHLYSIGFSFIRSSKLLANFVRLYVGAEGDFAFGPRTKIDFSEYAFDASEGRIIQVNEFPTLGNPRFHAYANALLGLEFCFLKHFGIAGEVRSGFGGHFVINESPVGLSKTVWVVGTNYYFKGY